MNRRISTGILTVVTIACALTVTSCGERGFDVRGRIGGIVSEDSGTEPGKSCHFLDGVIRVGDRLNLTGGQGQLLGSVELDPGIMDRSACDLQYQFRGVRAGESSYTLELESRAYPAVNASEQDLRADMANLQIRSQSDIWFAKAQGRPVPPAIYMAPFNMKKR